VDKITIVVPAYNEQNRIKSTLQNILSEFKGHEVIVVSDGSTDATADIVRGFPEVTLIVSEKTCGKGASIVKGIRRATGDVVGFLDADGSFQPSQIKRLINELSIGADCVIASKWVGKSFSEVGESTARKLAGRVWNLFVRVLLGLNISDTQAGAKFMRKNVFDAVDSDFICSGFEFDVELLYRIQKKGYTIKEVYLPFKDVEASTFRYGKTPRMFLNLIKIFVGIRL